jgi:hypothetical protein
MRGYGLWGIILLALDIWAILNIAQSNVSNGKKVLWILLVLLLPLAGLIVWYLLGPKSGKS